MIIKKNKNGTFDISGMTMGKLMAIVNAIDRLENNDLGPTAIQQDVRAIIKNNPDYEKSST